jgi:hypothetical protein
MSIFLEMILKAGITFLFTAGMILGLKLIIEVINKKLGG